MQLGDLFINIKKDSIFYLEVYKLATRAEYAEVNEWPPNVDALANDFEGWVPPECGYVLLLANAAGEPVPGNRWDNFTTLEEARVMEGVYREQGYLERYETEVDA